MRKPVAVSLISMPRVEYSSASAANAAWIVVTVGREAPSSNRSARSAGCSGFPAASKAASITFLMCDSVIRFLTGRRRYIRTRYFVHDCFCASSGLLISWHYVIQRRQLVKRKLFHFNYGATTHGLVTNE